MTKLPIGTQFADKAPLIVSFLLIVDSLHLVFARLLLPYLPPETSSMYVLGVGTLEMGIFLLLRGEIRFDVFRQNIIFFLVVGFLVAGATTLSYAAVAFIDPGTASLLAQTATIFALGFSLFWLKERLKRIELFGALVAITGVFTISFQVGDYFRLGSLIVLGGALMYSLHTAVVKRYGGELEFANFFFFRVASTTGFLLLFSVSRGNLQWPGIEVWPYLLLTGTVDVVISRVLYYLALRRLRLSSHAIFLTLSPVITILWSLFLFDTRPTLQGMLGGLAVIAGVAIVTQQKKGEST